MKIFQVIQKPQARGVELFTCLLSEKLKELGHEVILISLFEGNLELPFSGQQIHLKRSIKNRLWDLKAWREFAELIETEKPDLIQANAADTLKFTVFSKKVFGWKTPIIFRNASQISQYIQSPLIKNFNKYLYKQVDGILSVSQSSKSDFNSIFHFNKAHEVIPIGIEIPNKQFEKHTSDTPLLVHIGGFTFEKNHQELIPIFFNLKSKFPDLDLWLFGDGPLKQEIQKSIIDLGFENAVLFKGVVENPFDQIPQNAILVLPSIIEGLPSVILEAFAHNIPVIAYGVGGISEVIIDGETGWLIDPKNSKKFEEAIIEVINLSHKAIDKITTSAKEFVLKNYLLHQIAKKFETFYFQIIK